jgi:hypothetical protein
MKPSKAEADRLSKRFSRVAGRAVNPDEVEDALADFDDAAVTREETARYRTEIWDKTSPINGVPAAQVLAGRDDIPADGTVYLVYEGDRVLMFQPFDPDRQGVNKMTPAIARQKASKHVERLAEPRMRARMEQHLLGRLNIDPDAARVADETRAIDEAVEQRVREEVARIENEVRERVRRDEAERILREARA